MTKEFDVPPASSESGQPRTDVPGKLTPNTRAVLLAELIEGLEFAERFEVRCDEYGIWLVAQADGKSAMRLVWEPGKDWGIIEAAFKNAWQKSLDEGRSEPASEDRNAEGVEAPQ